jgi:tRNA-uridine 2-sulfurtransferase
MTTKAIALLSGGLDSALATKLVTEQGIEVIGLHFVSPLCNGIGADNGGLAEVISRDLGIRLIVKDKGEGFLDLVKQPSHGYGKNMNPCIDCKIYMLRAAAKVMAAEGASFVITGEVLGQRPMSQMRRTITMIEKESGLAGLILRPLSARLFPPSEPEREGLVDRDRLLAISGRSRKEQYRLAHDYDLRGFGSPAGGCLLTDPIYSRKLADLLAQQEPFSMKDVTLLRIGRHFRICEIKLVLGRNKVENEWLTSFWAPPYTLVYPIFYKGPVGIIKGPLNNATIKTVLTIVASHAKDLSRMVTLEFFDGRPRRETSERQNITADNYRIDYGGPVHTGPARFASRLPDAALRPSTSHLQDKPYEAD